MPTIEIKKCNNNVDVALRRLRRLCERAGINKRMRDRLEHHVTKTMKRRRQKAAACKRQLKLTQKEQSWTSIRPRRRSEASKKKVSE